MNPFKEVLNNNSINTNNNNNNTILLTKGAVSYLIATTLAGPKNIRKKIIA